MFWLFFTDWLINDTNAHADWFDEWLDLYLYNDDMFKTYEGLFMKDNYSLAHYYNFGYWEN